MAKLLPGQRIGTPNPEDGQRVLTMRELNKHLERPSFRDAMRRANMESVKNFGVPLQAAVLKRKEAINDKYTTQQKNIEATVQRMQKIKQELQKEEPKE